MNGSSELPRPVGRSPEPAAAGPGPRRRRRLNLSAVTGGRHPPSPVQIQAPELVTRDLQQHGALASCPECGRVFGSSRGLGVHRRSKHPEVYHAEKVASIASKKVRWSEEESHLLASIELEVVSTGARFVNEAILATGKFRDRTLEGIKGQRKKQGYRDLLARLRDRGTTLPGPGDENTGRNAGCLHRNIPHSRDENIETADMQTTELSALSPQGQREGTRPPPAVEQVEVEAPERRALNQGGQPGEEPPEWSASLTEAIDQVKERAFGNRALDYQNWVPGKSTAASRQQIDKEYCDWVQQYLPSRPRRQNSVRPPRPGNPAPNRRQRRKRQYATIQSLYRKDRKRCAEEVLSGNWREQASSMALERIEPYWRALFETESKRDDRMPERRHPVRWDMVAPVTLEEGARVLKATKKSAPGPDGLRLKDLKRMPLEELTGHANAWLLAGYQPAALRAGVTILIPKVANPGDPGQHRPITMSSLVARWFHKVLAKRLETLPFNARQRGFRAGDGLLDNTRLLRSAIKNRQSRCLPTHLVFVDVQKAFDSVSHQTLQLAAMRIGVPPPLLQYIESFYNDSTTVLRVGRAESQPIKVKQGVKQGDPMSGYLFLAVIDWAMDSCDPAYGISLDGSANTDLRLNCMAFADDVVLWAETACGLQTLLDQFAGNLGLGGLKISVGPTGKSASLHLVVDRKRKAWYVDARQRLSLYEKDVPAMGASDAYKYLGIRVHAKGSKLDAYEKLESMLSELTSAPLKPQQRLFLLRVNVLPKFQHQLVLGSPSNGYLKSLDKLVRKAVRSWLRLPHDTPLAFFYAKAEDGGLQIPDMAISVRFLQRARVDKMEASDDPLIRWIIDNCPDYDRLKRQSRAPQSIAGQISTSKAGTSVLWKGSLHQSVDGRGLQEHSRTPRYINSWVTSGSAMQSGAAFIRSIQLRGNLLYTRSRASRGNTNPGNTVLCDAGCGRVETLGHILQVCRRTYAPRIERHDAIVRLIATDCSRRGWNVMVEPSISPRSDREHAQGQPVHARSYRPDLVLSLKDKAVVVDVQIVADNASLSTEHRRKVDKYDTRATTEWVKRETNSRECCVTSVTLNWRGAIAVESERDLRTLLGVPKGTLETAALRTTEMSARCWLHHRSSTWRPRFGW